MAMEAVRPEDQIRPNKPPPHDAVVSFWKRTSARLEHRTRRILTCRYLRRGLLKVPLPPEWQKGNDDLRAWVDVALPERKMLDLTLSNILGERHPELHRVPLGTTDQAIEDGDQLETWGQSAFDASVDLDAVTGLLVQDGEFGAIVMPTRAGPEEPPSYTIAADAKGTLKVIKPDPAYDRDEKGKAPGTKQYGGRRDEKKSREAYDEARLRWLAEHHPWYVRLVNATDCAPLMVPGRGRGNRSWVPEGLLIRTLYDKEELLEQGFKWKSMGDVVLIPLDFDASRTYGNGGQVYLYELYLMIRDPKRPGKKKPVCVYSVGGEETWEVGDAGAKAAMIDFEEEYGLCERFWGYFYGMHLEDTPDWRGVPFIEPLVATIRNHELMRAAIRAASWDLSFTGHVEEVNPALPQETILEGFRKDRTTAKPLPGQTVKTMGPVRPYQQAQVGADAYRMLELDRQDLQINTPDEAVAGGGNAAGRSGHSLVVGQELLKSGKRQIGRGILDFAEFTIEQILRISCAVMAGGGGQPKMDVPVFVTEEEQLDDGDIREKTSVLKLEERWVGGQYRLSAEFPAEANLAEIEQAASLAERGFATDEDVDKARGIKNSVLAQVRRAIYRWRMSPQGQLEIDMRAAEYQGNEARLKLLRLVAAGQATAKGGPTAAIDPNVPGTAALGMGMQQQGPGGPGGPTAAQQSMAGTIGGQKQTAATRSDAMAQQQIGA